MAPKRQPIALEVAPDNRHTFRHNARLKEGLYTPSDLSHFTVDADGMEQGDTRMLRHRTHRATRKRGEAPEETGRERNLGMSAPRLLRLGTGPRGPVQHETGTITEKLLEEIGGKTGCIGKAVNEQPAGREQLRTRGEELRRATKDARPPGRSKLLKSPLRPSGDRDHRPRPDPLSAAPGPFAFRRQELLDRLAMHRLEAGVEQIAHCRRDMPVTLDQMIETLPQRGLLPRQPGHDEIEQQIARGNGRSGTLGDFAGETVESLESHTRGCPRPGSERPTDMEPQAPGRHDDPQRLTQETGVLAGLGQVHHKSLEQDVFGLPRSGCRPNLTRGRRSRGTEERELLRHP
jgi:hypothetical protein